MKAQLMFFLTFFRLRLPTDRLRRVYAIVGFTEDAVTVEEKITLSLIVGTDPQQSIVLLTFIVVRVSSAYNAILGRSGLSALRVVVST